MKKTNDKLKVICEITVITIVICVFFIGAFMKWQSTNENLAFSNVKTNTIAVAKFISGVDISSPTTILAKEQMFLDNHLQQDELFPPLTPQPIEAIIENVAVNHSKDIKIMEPSLINMESSYKQESKVFIYHSHARESWHGEDYTSDKYANSKELNITLLGERLGEELANLGIGSIVSTTDYASEVPGYEWAYSYKYSRKSVKEILAAHKNIEMVFDLHRDSQPRKYTTTTIKDEDYSQVYFIIGKRNENWEKNEAFAERLHNKIEELYPGLSRGLWGKNANSGNGEYNQSLHEKNILIEIGGVDNTLEENYRTIKALANVISILAKEDE